MVATKRRRTFYSPLMMSSAEIISGTPIFKELVITASAAKV
jgi:hypothetical protein